MAESAMPNASSPSSPRPRRQLPRLAVTVVALLPLLAATYAAAYWLRFEGTLPAKYQWIFLSTLAWVPCVKLLALLHFRIHQSWSRYITFHDLLVLGQAVTCSSIAITIIDALFLPQLAIPRSVMLLDWGTTLVVLGAARGLPRVLRDGGWRSLTAHRGVPALIVGANDQGESLLRAIRASAGVGYRPLGFVDDDPRLQGRRIAGVPVLGTTRDLARLVAQNGAEEVLVTSGELPGKQVRALVETAGAAGFRIKMLPSYEQLLSGQVAVRPRSVAIEDLLRRPPVELDQRAIRRWLSGRVLLVTGGAGSIGSEICRQLVRLAPAKLVVLDRAETGLFFIERELRRLAPEIDVIACVGDIMDRDRLDAVFRQHQPDIVFHAAAYKHVPLMEAQCGEAVKNISLGTRHLADLAHEHAAGGFVMISTDKAVNPTSIMGTCKRIAEQYVQAKAATSSCRMVTVRFGNVLDSAGSVVPVFREQIACGGPVTVTHPEMVRYFMLIPEAAQLVLQAGAMGQGGEIFVLDMGDPVRIVDLAEDMIRLSGLRAGEDIEIEFVGLRPGEKLFEELYGDAERHLPTRHPKILVAAGAERSLLEAIDDLSRLEDALDGTDAEIRRLLHEIVPPFVAEPQQPASERERPIRRAA